MIGLIALAILIFWYFVSYKLSAFLVRKVKGKSVTRFAQIALCVLLFLAPVADDIAGGFQFRKLCSDSATVIIDEVKAKDKTVIYQRVKDQQLTKYFVPILERYWSYKDAMSGEILISWKTYEAEGGWLSHAIGFPEGKPPYTFNGSCIPKGSFDFEKYNIKVQDKE